MKKLLVVFLSLIMCFGMSACGSKESSDGSSDGQEAKKIEKTVDAIAQELGFTDEKQEKAYQMVGAEDGAGYGNYEIYIYDEDSEAYADVTGDGYDLGILVVKALASNDGVIIVYSGEGEPDQAIIDKFNELNF